MSGTDWATKISMLVHFFGIACILALPIITVAVLIVKPIAGGELHGTAGFARYVGRIHHVSIIGAGIVLLTGIIQISLMNYWGELLTTQRSLLVKTILFILLVVNGRLLAGPAIFRRIEALQEASAAGVPSAAQTAALERTATLLRATGMPQAVLLIGIMIMQVFKPF